MSRVKMRVARERRFLVLMELLRREAHRQDVVLSIAGMAEACGLTCEQARSAMRQLRKSRMVQAFPRTLPNGGTAENAYRLTPNGLATLERANRELAARNKPAEADAQEGSADGADECPAGEAVAV